MSKVKRFLFIAIILSISILNQKNSWATDGYFWEDISTQDKQAYLTGFIDGAMSLGAEVVFSKDNKLFQESIHNIMGDYDLNKQLSIIKIVEAVDMFYNDYANKKIPVGEAYKIVLKRLRGVSELQIQKEIEVLRKVSSGIK